MKLGAARQAERHALIEVEVAPTTHFQPRAQSRQAAPDAPARGRYLLRTNLCDRDPVHLWQFYIQLVEVEAAFKNLKDDLAAPADLPPARAPHRSAHLRRLPGLLLHVTLRAQLKPLAPASHEGRADKLAPSRCSTSTSRLPMAVH